MTEKIEGNPKSDMPHKPAKLKRKLTLPLLTLYGLGVTIGAGIYVLVGATAAEAGVFAPISFILAAIVVGFTGFSYCELATRFPVSAGEAAYIREGFKSQPLSVIAGLTVAASGIVSSAAISIGAASYLQAFIPISPFILMTTVILIIGLVAIWGILESVTLAALFTLIEIAGLGFVVFIGVQSKPDLISELGTLVPPFEAMAWSGIFSAGLLAFFAFVGFEDMANVAEEVIEPRKTMPKGIMLTLLLATMIYVVVVSVVVLVVPMDILSNSNAPLALIFEMKGTGTKTLFTVIASVATVNGALIQVIMASRVIYGLSKQKSLPAILGRVNSKTGTPIIATMLVTLIIFVLAAFLPINSLAEITSTLVLLVFATVNIALIRIKWVHKSPIGDAFSVSVWVPVLGVVTCLILLSSGFLAAL